MIVNLSYIPWHKCRKCYIMFLHPKCTACYTFIYYKRNCVHRSICSKVQLHIVLPSQWRIWAHNYLTGSSHWNSRWAHFENTQLPHSELTRWLTLWACCELSISLQLTLWACCELFVRSSQWAHHAVVAVSSLCELQTHRKLTASLQCELILWVHCELTECPQNEPTVR